MRTTLDLPDDLMTSIKVMAAQENRRLKDMIAELLTRALAMETSGSERDRVRFPLVRCAHPALPEDEMTPERVARVLYDDEADNVRG